MFLFTQSKFGQTEKIGCKVRFCQNHADAQILPFDRMNSPATEEYQANGESGCIRPKAMSVRRDKITKKSSIWSEVGFEYRME